MPANWEHDIPGFPEYVKGNSFTRDAKLHYNNTVQITVDQSRLAKTNKIVPLDGHFVWNLKGDKKKQSPIRGRGNGPWSDLVEEFVLGDIRHLHRYVTKIEIIRGGWKSLPERWKRMLYVACRKYAGAFDIPFVMDEDLLKNLSVGIRKEKKWQQDAGYVDQWVTVQEGSITEARSAPLFHYMSYDKSDDVFATDEMLAKWQHDIPGMGVVGGNSFSRNPRFDWGMNVCLTVDQAKLAATNKIIPLDGHYVFYQKEYKNAQIRDRHIRGGRDGDRSDVLAEEFVIGDIKNLHRVITKIELCLGRRDGMTSHETVALFKLCRRYAKKWGIPLTVSREYVKRMRELHIHSVYNHYEDIL